MTRHIAADAADPRPGDQLPPVHPGEILLEDFMKPLNIKAPTAARIMGVPRTRIERLIAGATAVTPDTALRLERAFGSSAQFWLGLQADYDLEIVATRAWKSLATIQRIKPSETVNPAA